ISGKPVEEVGSYARAIRDQAARAGRTVRIAWNPMVGWEPGHVDALRPHFSYMTVDMPDGWPERLGVSDALVGELRAALRSDGPDAAARLVPDAVIDAFAIVGNRADVAARLAAAVAAATPELLVFGAHEYTLEHVGDVAALAAEVGLCWAGCSSATSSSAQGRRASASSATRSRPPGPVCAPNPATKSPTSAATSCCPAWPSRTPTWKRRSPPGGPRRVPATWPTRSPPGSACAAGSPRRTSRTGPPPPP